MGQRFVRWFLPTYFAVYFGFHTYALLHVHRAFGLSPAILALSLLVCVGGVAGPVAALICDRRGLLALARVVAPAAFVWMGYVLLLVIALVCLDFLRLGAGVLYFAGFGAPAEWLGGPEAAAVCLVVAGIASAYGWFEAQSLRVERVRIETDRLPPALPVLRIVQMSDVHVGFMNGFRRVQRLVQCIHELRPDVIVSTGDFVDSRSGLGGDMLRLFEDLRAPLGKFAVLGNHELYVGQPAVEFIESGGFRLLRNEGVQVAERVWVMGVDDPVSCPTTEPAPPPCGIYRILLKHRPAMSQNPVPFDLQLSGHTHGGQIFPFGFLVSRFYPLPDGLSRHGDCHLYKSRGSGSWGPPFRLLAPPEITFFEIAHISPTSLRDEGSAPNSLGQAELASPGE